MPDQQSLWKIRETMQATYEVRSRHQHADGSPRFINELIEERSPYLLQHAHNPVNWRRWSDTTFADASQQNKPIFLSIGYSTCHWCHVMEEESFDDEAVAEVLNRHFIAIKVDREQRPDVDEIYMAAVQLISGRGGWPMSVFLQPTGEPFYAATYFPKHNFMGLLFRISQLWQNDRATLHQHSVELSDAITEHLAPPASSTVVGSDLVPTAIQQLMAMADSSHGGFGSAPKFPQEAQLLFLLDYIARQSAALSEQPIWQVVKQALDAMLQGGIYDQLAGGFHRYSTDDHWLVPHFEKMLYNQAQLVRVYSQAYRLCGEPEYQRIACETIDYVLREMRSADGLFYSATDADSEGVEGKFFVWDRRELQSLLSAEDLELADALWGLTPAGNFEGSNILFLPNPLGETAARLGTTYDDLLTRIQALKEQLLPLRNQRTPPLTDNKVITEWNGMMIAALAEAGRIYGVQEYADAARQAVDQLLSLHQRADDSLCRLSMDRHADGHALLEDYAHCMEALLELYASHHQPHYLEQCQTLFEVLEKDYWDSAEGGYFIGPQRVTGPMLVRSKSLADQATISGNTQMLGVLQRLWHCTGDLKFKSRLDQHIAAFAEAINQQPLSALVFLKFAAYPKQQPPTLLQYGGHGQIKAEIKAAQWQQDQLALMLEIIVNDRWHVQAYRPVGEQSADVTSALALTNEPGNIATQLQLLSDNGHRLNEVQYPDATLWRAPNGDELEVYKGMFNINLTLKCTTLAPVRLGLKLQACDESACLPPEVMELVYWPTNCLNSLGHQN